MKKNKIIIISSIVIIILCVCAVTAVYLSGVNQNRADNGTVSYADNNNDTDIVGASNNDFSNNEVKSDVSDGTVTGTAKEEKSDIVNTNNTKPDDTKKAGSVSDWTLASKVPDGATVVDEKWTYDKKETVTTSDSSKSGYKLERSYWEKSTSGSFNYASFPAEYNTNDKYYKNYEKSPYTSYSNDTAKREVTTKNCGYIFWHWAFPHSNGEGDFLIGDYYNEYNPTSNCNYNIWECFQSTSGGSSVSGYSGVYKVTGHSSYSYYWFRFPYYQCNYTDYVKYFEYSKVSSEESSTAVSANNSISSVKHWVKYKK